MANAPMLGIAALRCYDQESKVIRRGAGKVEASRFLPYAFQNIDDYAAAIENNLPR